ncbi:MAG: ribosomal protein L7/L12 [Planctomycetota bacterium]
MTPSPALLLGLLVLAVVLLVAMGRLLAGSPPRDTDDPRPKQRPPLAPPPRAAEPIRPPVTPPLAPPPHPVPTAASPTAARSAAEQVARIEAELRAGKKIQAIKLYRELYGVGLKEAKDAVEAMERGAPAPASAPAPAAAAAPATLPGDEEILAALRSGQKILAIKLYRERHGVGLKEAKDAVDRMG